MKAKIIEKKIKKWSEFLAEAAICKAKVYPVGAQFVYDEGSLPSGMTGISAGDILNLQRENGMSSYDVPGSSEDWVRIDGNPGDGSGLDLTVEQTLTAAQKQAVAQNINDRPAQVDSETETVVSMGYKVLDPNKSFAAQVESTQTVDNSNMIFEIKDAFDVKPNNSGDVVFTRELTSNIVIGTKRIFYNPTTVTVDPANSLTGKYIFESNEVGLLPVKESYQSYDKVYTKHIFDSSENVYLAKAVYNYAKYTINKSGVYQSDSAGELVNATTIGGTDYISSAAFTLKSNAMVANRETIVADEGCVILNSDGTSIISDENRSFTPADSSNVSVRIGMVVPTFTETFTIKPLYTINSGSVLKFNGGKIKNGAIDIEDVVIPQDSKGVFGEGIVITGRPTTIPMADWFDDASDSDKIRRCIEAFGICNLGVRNYIIDKPIIVSRSFTLKGQGMPDFPSHRDRFFDLNETDCGSNLIAQQGVSSILVVNNSVNGSSSALIDGVTFTAAIGNNRGSNGIEWCTPGAPSRPVIIRNCNFQFLNYGIYIHKGDSGKDDTNVAFATIECNNAAQCRWAIYCEDTYSLFNARIVGNNFEFNTVGAIKIDGRALSSLDISWNDFEGQPTALDISVFWNIVYVKGNYFESVDDIYFRGTYPDRSMVDFTGNYFWSPYANNTITTVHSNSIRFLNFETVGNVDKVKLDSTGSSSIDKIPKTMPIGDNVIRVDYKNCKNVEQISNSDIIWNSYTDVAPDSHKERLAPTHIFEGIPLKEFSDLPNNSTVLIYTNSASKLNYRAGVTYYVYFYAISSTIYGGHIGIRLYNTSGNNDITPITPVNVCYGSPSVVGLYRIAFTLNQNVESTHWLGIQIQTSEGNAIYVSDFYISTNRNIKNLPIRPFNPTLIENAEKGTTLYSNPLGKNITYNGTAWVEEDSEMAGIARSGTFTNKPSPTNIGFTYFCTSFGKPIFWNGTAWVDANGETVGLQVSDTSVLIGAAADSSVTINVYHTNALTVSALNPDNTPATWLTVPSTVDVGTNTLTISAAANTASNPRGAKVIISDGTDVVIINVVQNYATT
ncbi:MAG: BACON domain-containing protein [Bacteroidales bacterium]|nr:BACON domain-containing protein [Bacteroidales bacterium]